MVAGRRGRKKGKKIGIEKKKMKSSCLLEECFRDLKFG